MPPTLQSTFGHLQEHDEQLVRLGVLAEQYLAEDPNTCLLKLRARKEVALDEVHAVLHPSTPLRAGSRLYAPTCADRWG